MVTKSDLLTCLFVRQCESEPYRSPRLNSPYCPKCRANMGLWEKAPAEKVKRRISNLTLYSERMDTVTGARMHKVVPMRRRLHA